MKFLFQFTNKVLLEDDLLLSCFMVCGYFVLQWGAEQCDRGCDPQNLKH